MSSGAIQCFLINICYLGKPTSTLSEPHANTERIFFNDTAVHSSEMYCLVYVAQRGEFIEILGVSLGFSGRRNSIEPCASSFT